MDYRELKAEFGDRLKAFPLENILAMYGAAWEYGFYR